MLLSSSPFPAFPAMSLVASRAHASRHCQLIRAAAAVVPSYSNIPHRHHQCHHHNSFFSPSSTRSWNSPSHHYATAAKTDTHPIQEKLPDPKKVPFRFREFDLNGKVFVVTGGARGLGLALAEALIEAGGIGG